MILHIHARTYCIAGSAIAPGSFMPADGSDKMKCLNATALTIAIIGAINWGLIGFFRFDLVAWIFGDMSWISRIIYALVGLSGLYLITFYARLDDRSDA